MAVNAGSTIMDYLVPSRSLRGITLLRDILLVAGFSVFTALCAQVSFHIPITPVPITLQTLAVLSGVVAADWRCCSTLLRAPLGCLFSRVELAVLCT